ncbi:hypothetical protein [Roseobacter sp. S98]|uniref:hypothetical protein n=1 Tax=Roseobacter algicola (ex Choi et al. 2025) (nom. illeg.) TaxID=3092138 RepID=UPI0035C7878E
MIYEDRITDLLNAAQAGKLSADRALREASDKKVTQLFTDIRDDLVNKRKSIDTINVSLEKDRAREEGLASEIKQLAEEKEELERSLGALERAADNAGAQMETLQTRLSSSPGDEEKSELEKSLQKAEAALAEAVAGQEPRRERLRAIPKDAEAAIAQRSTLTERLREKAENRSANIWSFLELADEFAAGLSERITSGLDRIIPDDGVDREYLIESDTENLLGKEELINRLKQPDTGLEGDDTSSGYQLRLNSAELENRVQLLLDHMTGQRIVEEQDTDTYVHRLKNAYSRVAKSSEIQSRALREGRAADAAEMQARLEQIVRLAELLATETEQVGNPEHPYAGRDEVEMSEEKIRNGVSQTKLFAGNAENFAKQAEIFLGRSADNLEKLVREFCHKRMIKGAVDQSMSVSRAAEVQTFYRPLPFVWAVLVTLLTKAVFAGNTALILHDNAGIFLTLTFVSTWTFSIFIGIRNRAKRMQRLQLRTRESFERMTDPSFVEPEKMSRFMRIMFWSGLYVPEFESRAVRFAPEPFSKIVTNRMSVKKFRPFDFARSARNGKLRMARNNAAALLIPGAFLVLIQLMLPDPEPRAYVSVLENGQTCFMEEGTLTSATPSTYYVKPVRLSFETVGEDAGKAEPDAPGLLFARWFFPELLSETVAREKVTGILPVGDVRLTRMPDCEDGVFFAKDIGIDAPDKLFPLALREDVVSAQKMLFAIMAEGSASEEEQKEFSEVFRSIRESFGPSMTKAQTLELILKGDLTAVPEVQETGEPGTVTQNFQTRLEGVGEIAAAIREAGVTSGDVMARLIRNNTDALEQLAALRRQASHSVIPLIIERGAPQILPQTPAASFVVSPTVRLDETRRVAPFVTHVTLPGAQQERVTIQNSLFMPFFPDPIREKEIRVPLDAYRFGVSNAGFKPPMVSAGDDSKTYFEVVVDAIRSCLRTDETARIAIGVQGHASSLWLGAIPQGYTKDDFNHALAEGRRMGALVLLREKLNAEEASRVWVAGRGESSPLTGFEILSGQSEEQELREAFEAKRLFDTHASMSEEQRTWMSSVQLETEDKLNAFEELFARTVIIEVKSVEGTSCTLN